MAVIEVTKIIRISKHGHRRKRWAVRLQCDQCNCEFVSLDKRTLSNVSQFCSGDCAAIARRHDGHTFHVIRTCALEKHGVSHLSQLESVKSKRRDTCIQKYGVISTLNLDGVHEKANLKLARNKAKKTMLERYGVEHSMQSSALRRKAHLTKKKNGVYQRQSSNTEDRLFELLCETYGPCNVLRHIEVNGWVIDMFIKSKEIYIQVDGVYWHGLDRPLEMLQNSSCLMDISILGTHARDLKQNDWFKAQQLQLVRVTDLAVADMTIDDVRVLRGWNSIS